MLANLKKGLSKEDIKCRCYFNTATFLGAPSAWKNLKAKKWFNKKCFFIMYHSPLPAHLHIVTIDGGYPTFTSKKLY
jgi:hypothetical protein